MKRNDPEVWKMKSRISNRHMDVFVHAQSQQTAERTKHREPLPLLFAIWANVLRTMDRDGYATDH